MQAEQNYKKTHIFDRKSTGLSKGLGQYVFEVARNANKIQIRDAVQTMFKVTVVSVNTMVMRGKMRRMGRTYAKLHNWKKAIVTLKPGDSIDFMSDEAVNP